MVRKLTQTVWENDMRTSANLISKGHHISLHDGFPPSPPPFSLFLLLAVQD